MSSFSSLFQFHWPLFLTTMYKTFMSKQSTYITYAMFLCVISLCSVLMFSKCRFVTLFTLKPPVGRLSDVNNPVKYQSEGVGERVKFRPRGELTSTEPQRRGATHCCHLVDGRGYGHRLIHQIIQYFDCNFHYYALAIMYLYFRLN